MLRLYCRACRLRFSPAAATERGNCPRCEARVPSTRVVEANTWLASTVLAEMRGPRGNRRRTGRAQ
jgi:hypothetical protein